jgi:tetratricopeptide (TPR) repeat protein
MKKFTLILGLMALFLPSFPYAIPPTTPNSNQHKTIQTPQLNTQTNSSNQTKDIEVYDSQSFEKFFNQGIDLFKEQRFEEATAQLQRARELEPEHPQTYFNLGLICMAQDKYNQASSYFEQAVMHKPDYAKAYLFLGQAATKLNLFDTALQHYNKVLELIPEHYETYLQIARLFRAQNKTDETIKQYHKAIALQPNNILGIFDLAYLYTTEENYDEAIPLYKKILDISPNQTDALCNLAHILRYKGSYKEAISYYKQLLARKPDYAHAHYGIAESYLMLGDMERGWQEFEWRWKRATDTRNFGERLWDGSHLEGKTILLRGEYGQGDTLQFVRYASLLKEQGATVILEAQHTLVKLLSLCPYIDHIVPIVDSFSQLPPFDVQLPLMSLPRMFKTTLETVPHHIPYLQAKPELIALWNEKTKDDPNFKIGICWEGSPYYEQFKTALSKKSVPVNIFIPIAQLPGVSLYSLQKINGTEQLNELPKNITVYSFGDSFDTEHGRYMDTAALIKNLDLVITVDTSVAHLAGALGKPVWVLLPQVADWRWMLNRSDTPWYPTMKLFRQYRSGDWDSVIATVINELKPLITSKLPCRSNPAKTTIPQEIKAPVSVITEVQVGELIDKMTILQIKSERIKDKEKLKNIRAELETLLVTQQQHIPSIKELENLTKELKEVNEKLWVIEDDIREKERTQSFDNEFIKLARNVYYTNDERCRIKREINKLVGSRFMEEKSYTDYKTTAAA